MKFFAHSTESTDKSDWQRLSAHLLATGDGAAARAAFFGGQALAQICGQLHDLGKYTEQFQARLAGEVPKVDHATWGAHIAAKPQGWGKMDDDGKALLNEIWDALRPLRLVGWVETWRRSVIAFALRCGWIEDGRFRAGSEEIVMIGWSR